MIESLGRETLLYADAGALRAYDSESQEGFFAVHRSSPDRAQCRTIPITLSISRDAVYLFDRDGHTLRYPAAGNATHSKH